MNNYQKLIFGFLGLTILNFIGLYTNFDFIPLIELIESSLYMAILITAIVIFLKVVRTTMKIKRIINHDQTRN